MWLRIVVGTLLVLMILPILVIIPMSFSSEVAFHFPPKSFSLRWYEHFLNNDEWIEGLGRSALIAICTTIISTTLGMMAALAVNRLNFPGKKLFMNAMIAPMIIPVIVVGIALYVSFSQFNLVNTILGLVLAHTILAIPIVFITILASLKGMDKNIELASLSLGATPIGTFFRITLPILRSSVLSSFFLAFIISLDEVTVTIFIAGPHTKTLPIMMWDSLNMQVDPTIAVVSTVLIVATVLLFVLFPGLIQASGKKDYYQN